MTAVYLALAALTALGCWRVSVALWPTRLCPSCKGRKTNAGSNRQRWGTCRRCGGTGHVRRLGARKP